LVPSSDNLQRVKVIQYVLFDMLGVIMIRLLFTCFVLIVSSISVYMKQALQ